MSNDYAVGFWEEHCIECGAPMCYVTCAKFKRSPGGGCRRFANGIEKLKSKDKSCSFAVNFLPWGKLEMYWQGKMASTKSLSVVRCISNMCEPIFVRLLSERLFRGLRRRFTRLLGKSGGSPNLWRIACTVNEPTELRAAVADANNDELLTMRLALHAGKNEFAVSLPRISAPAYFRLSSIDGTNGQVVFSECDVVFDSAPDRNTKSARYVKCVAWDLDNTLWNGVLAEVGAAGIRLRKNVVDAIVQLDKRGILSTICSKNDFDVAWPVLKSLGISEYFVFPRICWGAKSDSLKRIAKDINIGIDTFAFVDDSFHERGEVAENLPCIRVYSDAEIDKMLMQPAFNPPVSEESASRRQRYLVEMERRHDEEQSTGSREDFIRRCEMVLSLSKIIDEETSRRCWELVNRTNQLTLAAHRYSEDEFRAIAAKADAYAVRCKDKYGDYGIVGFIAFEENDKCARIEEFVMSCRVAKKFCEQSVLLSVAEKIKRNGCDELVTEVVETGRNGALVAAFDAMPFEKCRKDGRVYYKMKLLDGNWRNLFRNEVVFDAVY